MQWAHTPVPVQRHMAGRGGGMGGAFPDEQEQLEDYFFNFVTLQEDLTLYRTITMAALLVMVIQLVAKLNFHPRLGVISRTLLAAASDLVFFFILFIFITMVRGVAHASIPFVY